MNHTVTVGPSSAVIVDANGRVSELKKQRTPTWRAKCTCGWSSPEYAEKQQAAVVGKSHERVMGRMM